MTARATVAGERGDAIESPGVARRAAMYRTLFGVCLVMVSVGVVVAYYWHRHQPAVVTSGRSRSPHSATTEMRLPKLTVDEVARPEKPLGDDPAATAVASTSTAIPAVPALPPSLSPAPNASATRRTPSPLMLKPTTGVEPSTMAVAAPAPVSEAPVRSPVKVLHAAVLPAQRFLLTRGSFLDCTLETAVDSTLPGLATCVLSGDVYGADGTVVLLPRGSRLVGETHADVRPGQARVGITWTEARTPQGLLLPLAAAATDALGRAGVPGAIDRHTTERFGAAVMLSVIDTAVSALMNRRQTGNGVVYNVQGSRDVATEALRQSIHIPPTIRVEPGARVDVIVAADVDFSDVYQLVSHGDS